MTTVDPATAPPAAPRRAAAGPAPRIERRSVVPGGRAVVGGLLMALAAVGTYLAATGADDDGAAVVVAARSIRVGHTIEPRDLRVASGVLAAELGGATFVDPEAVIGRVALGPIAEGEILQAGSLTSDASAGALHEVALTLPRAQVAVGRLKEGERLDVFVTRDDRTTAVVRGATLVQLGVSGDASLTSAREIQLVLAVPAVEAVADVVHALRTGDVTVVRSTFADVTITPGNDAADGEGDGEGDGEDDGGGGR